jgi:F-type H+-transporting ATPase subunit delta
VAETNTLARPYAKAAFELARSHDNLAGWSDMLAALTAVVSNEDTQALIGNPLLAKGDLLDLIIGVCGERLDEQGRNFARLLVEEKRLGIVSAIAELFEKRKDESQGRMAVEVHSAVELPESRKQSLSQALERRLRRSVDMECKTDPDLIGGIVIYAGDEIIDHSVRNQLHQLVSAINR